MVKMTKKPQFCAKLAGLLAIALLATFANASVLAVGGTAPPTPLTPTGPVLASKSGTITALTFSANYTTWVYADPTNTWCSGCLDFVYEFTNLGPAPNQRYSMSSFGGFNIDAGTNPFGPHDPNTVSRSASLNGDVISFNFDNFGNDVLPGETTVQLVIETDARYYTQGILSAQDGSSGSAYGFQPSAVPEPSSLALMGSGITAFAFVLRKFRSRKSV